MPIRNPQPAGSATAFELLAITGKDVATLTTQGANPATKTTTLFTVSGAVDVVLAVKTKVVLIYTQSGSSFQIGRVGSLGIFMPDLAPDLDPIFTTDEVWWPLTAHDPIIPIALTDGQNIQIKASTIAGGGNGEVTGNIHIACFWRPTVFGSGATVVVT